MSNITVSEENNNENNEDSDTEENNSLYEDKIEQRKNEIIGILIAAWGFLSLFAVFTNKTGIIGRMISNFLFYLSGKGAYLIPFLFIIWGFYLIRFKHLKINTRLFGFLLSYVMTLALIHTYMFNDFTIRYALLGKGGGIIGGSISSFFLKFFAELGTYIILGTFL